MSTVDTDFAPLHSMLVRWIQQETGVRTSGSIPEDLTTAAHVVYALPGQDVDGLAEVRAFDVQTFAPTYDEADRLASAARKAVARMAARDTVDDGRHLVDWTRCSTPPYLVSYENPKVSRLVGTYRLAARAQ